MPLISTTWGKRYTMKVRQSTVLATSLFSMVSEVSVCNTSSLEI